MRRVLGQVAFVVARSGDPSLKRWHAQISKRRGIQVAKTALSRKILVITWAMMRDSIYYQDPEQPDENSSGTALYSNKVRELEEQSQDDQRTTQNRARPHAHPTPNPSQTH